jgi:hypothetical protein
MFLSADREADGGRNTVEELLGKKNNEVSSSFHLQSEK